MSVDNREFDGFSQDALSFLKKLKKNNNRVWFEKHREEYQEHVVKPSHAFIESLKAPFGKINPDFSVTPKAMFRISRDIRFSADKSPYKTWIGYHFRDLKWPKELAPSFYVGWDPTGVSFAAGLRHFSSPQRDLFRTHVTRGPASKNFSTLVKKLRRHKGFELRGKELKRIPPAYDPKHPNAEFLLYQGIYIFLEENLPKSFGTSKLIDHVVDIFNKCTPLYDWIKILKA